MSGKKNKKIVIPTEQEMTEYGGEPPGSEVPPAAPATGQGEVAAEAPVAEGAGGGEGVEAGREAAEWKDKFLRAKAELANYQRRSEKDRAETLRYAQGSLVQALLPILDDLERVIESGLPAAGDAVGVFNGVRLTVENLQKVLRGINVSRIEALGRPFDPTVHQAVMERESGEHAEPTVLEEVAKGYQLYDRVLRPARVVVSKAAAAEPGKAGGDGVGASGGEANGG